MTASSWLGRDAGGGWDWVWSRDLTITHSTAVAMLWAEYLWDVCDRTLLDPLFLLVDQRRLQQPLATRSREPGLRPMLAGEAVRAAAALCLSSTLPNEDEMAILEAVRAVIIGLMNGTTSGPKIRYSEELSVSRTQFLLALALVMEVPEETFVTAVGWDPRFWSAYAEWQTAAEDGLARLLGGEIVPLEQMVPRAQGVASRLGPTVGDRVAEALEKLKR